MRQIVQLPLGLDGVSQSLVNQADAEKPSTDLSLTREPAPQRSLPPLTAGVDEVGRGALFGPVVAAAVILTPDQEQYLQEIGSKTAKPSPTSSGKP